MAAAAQGLWRFPHTQVEPQSENLNPLTFSYLPLHPPLQQPQERESLANEEPKTLQWDEGGRPGRGWTTGCSTAMAEVGRVAGPSCQEGEAGPLPVASLPSGLGCPGG